MGRLIRLISGLFKRYIGVPAVPAGNHMHSYSGALSRYQDVHVAHKETASLYPESLLKGGDVLAFPRPF